MEKETYYKLALFVGVSSLGLAAYNTIAAAKERALLKEKGILGYSSLMGETDPMSSIPTVSSESIQNGSYFNLTEGSNLVFSASETYVDRGLDTIEKLLQSEQLQSALKSAGVSLDAKSLTKERIKSLLAAYGLFSTFLLVKSNILKIGVIALSVYLYSQNRQNIQMALNKVLGDNQSVA